jgi:hypothetical protein
VRERLEHAVRGDHRAHRDIRRSERLGGGDDVGLIAVALASEPVAEPAPGADHLVGDEQHVVAVADLSHAVEVAVLGRDAAAGVLQRLEDHRGDRLRPLEEDPLLDLVRGPERVAIGGPVVAVGVRGLDPAGDQRFEVRPQLPDPRRLQSPEGGPVVRDLA